MIAPNVTQKHGSAFPVSDIENPGDLTKDDVADDLECPLKVISGINSCTVCIKK